MAVEYRRRQYAVTDTISRLRVGSLWLMAVGNKHDRKLQQKNRGYRTDSNAM